MWYVISFALFGFVAGLAARWRDARCLARENRCRAEGTPALGARAANPRISGAARAACGLAFVLAAPLLAACDNADRQAAPAAGLPIASPTSTASPAPVARGSPDVAASPRATPSAELRRRAEQPAFPQGEVVHIVLIQEPLGINDPAERAANTARTEIWLDQASGAAVKRTDDAAGTLRMLTVKQDLTIDRYRADGDTTVLTRHRVRSPDDPRLDEVTSDLTGFRELILRGRAKSIENEPFHGQPAVKIVVPYSESGQAKLDLTFYLDPETLYPIALIGPGGQGYTVSYPTIEGLSREQVPPGTFDPQPPTEPRFTYIHEQLAPDEATRFTEYPIWSVGPSFMGYTLDWMERYRTEDPPGMDTDRDTVTLLYLPIPDDHQHQLQIISQPPLSDIEWAHRDANHNVHHFVEREIQGSRAWQQIDPLTGRGYVEIAFPDSYVSISAPSSDLALAVANAVRRMNPGVTPAATP